MTSTPLEELGSYANANPTDNAAAETRPQGEWVLVPRKVVRCLLVENRQHQKHLRQMASPTSNRLDEYISLLVETEERLIDLSARPSPDKMTDHTGEAVAWRYRASDWPDGEWVVQNEQPVQVPFDSPWTIQPLYASASPSSETAQTDRDRSGFQPRVSEWMMACFGADITNSLLERCYRFFEEAGELCQALGMTEQQAADMVVYTWGRDKGEPAQEVGGVMVTLAALCFAAGLDMAADGETELTRISAPEIMDKIRRKHEAKVLRTPHSALPGQALGDQS